MADRRGFNPNPELSKLCTELWELDEQRLVIGKDVVIDLQGRTWASDRRDKAEDPLFSYVDPTCFARPTFKLFIALLDNYETSTGVNEEVTDEEVKENKLFINAIMETKVMKRAHDYLVSCGKSPREIIPFKRQLYDIWFKLYRRTRGVLDSSGFEHVFVGETRDGKILGFHNWIQFYLQEKAGNVDYQGYVRHGKHNDYLLTIKFTWNKEVKPFGSTFVGTSPEFEMALYTIMFLCSPEETTDLDIAGQNVTITCYKHGLNLGTSYPSASK
ncbi:PREDICTED: poly(U)-specific endoribonuclease-like [Amphimedon queenslandica]|uniref:Uridylate-specific endoribonuclease n=1 Tax=Amphimedon queenslandica TaxID=400682 RepID=A0A1X7VGW2_AMPQE|nr:PREDICTED: poly(U)-specific endoribonuclease-like [Amphimedon queenslandica]|eukprot:XP_003384369.1 PREDICTED: poly(U)-specific endoribonuclease-like [Amphimedon queenslandica]